MSTHESVSNRCVRTYTHATPSPLYIHIRGRVHAAVLFGCRLVWAKRSFCVLNGGDSGSGGDSGGGGGGSAQLARRGDASACA